MKRVGIVGMGGIGKHLWRKLDSRGINIGFAQSRSGEPSFESNLEHYKPHAVFIAIPTFDEGEAARDYMLTCVKAGIPVITCEKGSLAYHAEVLRPHLEMIGCSAAVGGGTRMLKYIESRRFCDRRVEIHAVLNGTLNYIFDEIRRGGRTLGEACLEAERLGYAEPGAKDPLSLINGELKDVRMKTCVFFNRALATKRIVTPREFGLLEVSPNDLTRLNEEAGDYRLVVSFVNHKDSKSSPFFGKQFALHYVDGWHITGSFRQITQASQLATWLPGGVGNAVHIIEGELGSGGKYTLSGPGAGYEPTVSAMLADFDELCRYHAG